MQLDDRALIAPSILNANFMALGDEVRLITDAGADWVHVDVMDGHFVPNLSIGPAHVSALKKVTDLPLDVHLMIDNPEVQVPWYIEAGADSVTVHVEACSDLPAMIESIHAAGVKAGVAVNPETPIEQVVPALGTADLVLVMSFHPGFGGQSFIEDTPDKVCRLVELCDEVGANPIIEIDGGINAKTASLAYAAGVRMFVAGSAIFKAAEPAKALEEIRNACC